MKKIRYVVTLLAIAMLGACNFSAGIKHNMNTGLTVKNSGLDYEDYKLSYNDVAAADNQWAQGETVKLTMNGMNGFKVANGLVYPGISYTIKDLKGHVIEQQDDLLQEEVRDGITPDRASKLSALYTMGENFEAGKEYEMQVCFFDKKGDGKVTATMKFKVLPLKQNDLKVNVAGLSYDHIYFRGRNGRKENEALIGGPIGVLIQGVRGLKEENGKVFPGGEIMIYQENGKELYHSEDLFKDYPRGIDPEKVAQDISLYLTPEDKKTAGNYGKWVFRIWDKKSKATLEAEIMLTLR